MIIFLQRYDGSVTTEEERNEDFARLLWRVSQYLEDLDDDENWDRYRKLRTKVTRVLIGM